MPFQRDKSLRKRLADVEKKKAQHRVKKQRLNPPSSSEATSATVDKPLPTIPTSESGLQTFQELHLSEPIQKAVDELSYTQLTPVQSIALPILVKQGKDALVSARTGSGKTLTYVLPLLQRLREMRPRIWSGTCAIVIVPTRELAIQVYGVLRSVAQFTTFRTLCMTGGKKRQEEITELLRGSAIVVATPGRLLSYLQRRVTTKTGSMKAAKKASDILEAEWEERERAKEEVKRLTLALEREEVSEEDVKAAKEALKSLPVQKIWFPVHNLRVLVVDEVDRMLEQGFFDTLKKICDSLPSAACRQTMLFSATVSEETVQLAQQLMRPDFERVQVSADHDLDASSNQPANRHKPLEIEAVHVFKQPERKFLALISLIVRLFGKGKKFMVFLCCIPEVEFFAKMFRLFKLHGEHIFAMHSQLSEQDRRSTFMRFCRVNTGLLFCTDVAARGLDVPDVDWVIQYDPPRNVNEYLHRVGRTGRAGATGNAVLFLAHNETRFLDDLAQRCPEELVLWEEFPFLDEWKPSKMETEGNNPWPPLVQLQQMVKCTSLLYNMATAAYFGILKSYIAYPRKYYGGIDLNALAKSLGLKKEPNISGDTLRRQAEQLTRKRGRD